MTTQSAFTTGSSTTFSSATAASTTTATASTISYSSIFQTISTNFMNLFNEIREGRTSPEQINQKLEQLVVFTKTRHTVVENLLRISQSAIVLNIFKKVYPNDHITCLEDLETDTFSIYKFGGHFDDIGAELDVQKATNARAVEETSAAFAPLSFSLAKALSDIHAQKVPAAKSATLSPPTEPAYIADCVIFSPPTSARFSDNDPELSLAPLAASDGKEQPLRLNVTESANF